MCLRHVQFTVARPAACLAFVARPAAPLRVIDPLTAKCIFITAATILCHNFTFLIKHVQCMFILSNRKKVACAMRMRSFVCRLLHRTALFILERQRNATSPTVNAYVFASSITDLLNTRFLQHCYSMLVLLGLKVIIKVYVLLCLFVLLCCCSDFCCLHGD